ncbi:hypothetical protein DYB32_003955 [Aphanomyces invadans]|uniref:Serine/threonine-protein phosphatase 1 regulatory subunit 10 n=1 Tax=Aphanomyces invadans TaxID=157072 RepID=A0A3R6VN29_9STRA|nr:hypothetical protein DYB32_003955 [Aphanomyces invadans]
MMALETKMTPNFSNLLQTQHRGYAQMLQTFDGRVQEHEALTGVHPITGKVRYLHHDTIREMFPALLNPCISSSFPSKFGMVLGIAALTTFFHDQTTNKRKRGETSMVGSPMNAFEETLIACCDASNVLRDNVATERFLPLLNQAKTESDQAKLLCVLAATAKVPERLSSVDQFESFGGVKVARQWLDKAVSYRQTSLLHFILVTLKELPLQLSSITDAKINEPVVQLRKTATNEHVKRAAQDLLKHWKTTFTEKPAPIAKESTSPPSKGGAKAKAAAGGGDLLGKLLLKKQEANKVINKPKDSFVTKMVQNSQQLKKDAAAAAAAAPAVSSPVALPTIARFDQVQSQLPSAAPSSRRIKWADEHGSELTKIKLIESWRDLIMHNEKDDPSSPMVTGGTFKDAKLREHANEKFALQKYVPTTIMPFVAVAHATVLCSKHKEESSRSRAVAIPTVSWRTPPTLQLPEGVTPRFTEETNETMAQVCPTFRMVCTLIVQSMLNSGYLGEGYGYGAGGGYPDEHRYSDPSQRYADDGPRFNKRNPHESGMPDMSYPSKRPAFALPHGGGGGPGSYKYKQVPCIYFNSPAGCGKGEACTFIHDEDARGAGGVAASKYAPRGGHGPPPFKGGGPKPNYYGGGGGRGGAFR